MGGLYQMTQLYFRGHDESLAFAAGSVDCAADERMLAMDFRDIVLFSSFSGSLFSFGVGGTEGLEAATLLKSKAVPGVFGVFAEEPKEAKAPEPNPKAEEPPVVGDEIPLVARGATELKGLFRPCDEVLPKRLGFEKSRDECPSLPSCFSDLSMDNDSFPMLLSRDGQSRPVLPSAHAMYSLRAASPKVVSVLVHLCAGFDGRRM